MSRFDRTIPPGYFDEIYAANADPWQFAASPYERDKYTVTLAALPREHYERALEVGCSIGVFTRQLAPRCTTLLALDLAEAALVQAKSRCADQRQVEFRRAQVPDDWPDGRYDLILLSEVVYYLDQADVARLASRVRSAIEANGDILLVHWLGETHYPLTGDEAADAFIKASMDFAQLQHQSRTADYRLDLLRAH